ncbi:MAG: Acyl-CoA synthetase/AMP-acid ligase II [Magnetococcales bacterium]|nr:Acyl-CoA synthetase/AMP-acid ligase II [Magnetococcales bacterium]HIJ85826.1 acyl-[ACP]--phospholipid O-acyltransferase [Magnetococcales bacterium]
MIHGGNIELLQSKRLGPLFVTQFLGALNDNVFKNALVMLITYRIAAEANMDGRILVSLAGGLFILPFFLFSALAGQWADKSEKSQLIRRIKLAEIAIMGLACLGFVLGNLWFLLTVLFLLGAQATFFGPVKYAILPNHLAKEELIAGNAFVEAGTFLAILLGTIASGLVVLKENGVELIMLAIMLIAVGGWYSSRFIPQAAAACPSLVIETNLISSTWSIMRQSAKQREVFLSIMGISWFWLTGATYLTQFPTFAKDIIGGNEEVVVLFLTVFSVGIGLGSLMCNRLLAGRVSAQYVPLGALGMALFSIDLVAASQRVIPGELIGVTTFLGHVANWRILVDLLGMAIASGIYIVPLYAIMQTSSSVENRSQVIAGNNIMNALFMVVSALSTVVLLALGFTIPGIFLAMAVANLLVASYICKLLPDALVKTLLARLFGLLYRVELKGWHHWESVGERAVIVVNHVSFLDAALLATYMPGKPTFAINTHMAGKWWVRPFLRLIDAFALDPSSPFAIKSLAKWVKEGRRCVIFPEGRITVTGALMKIYEGPGLIADRADAVVVPIRIDGAQFTPFSRLKGKVRLRWFPKIVLTMLPPRRFEVDREIKGRQRRQILGQQLYDLLSGMVFATSCWDQTLDHALLEARIIYGGGFHVLEDIQRQPVTYDRLITISRILGRRFRGYANPGATIGLLMPNSVAGVSAFFGLQAAGMVPAMLNFSSGLNNIRNACIAAQVQTILTSRRFVAMARLQEVLGELDASIRILYLEDIFQRLGKVEKMWGWLRGRRDLVLGGRKGDPDAAAVVLFTSGSEGTPKGVVLSHRNLMANCRQLSARIDYNPTDIVFNALPIFHSFGLTAGLLLPVLSGIKSFVYPSPLHYRIVPEMVYDCNATIMFGTDTFLKGYARVSNPYDYYSVRYVFAGAEKVKEDTRRMWMDRFGLRIFEGYGATETAPALATNTAMHYRPGTVGRFLPGIHYRLEKIPGIENGGQLLVSGPNVMKGYLRTEHPGVLEPPKDGWYDTGDIVEVDDQGYVTIAGRVKRFAKLAGEMVSLTAVENQAATLWPGRVHAVVAVADPKKGEQVVLVTDDPGANRNDWLEDARKKGIPELMVPKKIMIVDKVPVLGTGKLDYVAIKTMALG